MIKRALGIALLIPVVFLVSLWGVNIVSGVMAGDINVVCFIMEHKLIISIIVAYFVFKFVNPFNK